MLPQTKNGEGRIVYLNALAQQALAVVPQAKAKPTDFALLRSKPIANWYSQSLGTLHPSNPSSQIGAQETGIRGFVCQPPDCGEPQVNGG